MAAVQVEALLHAVEAPDGHVLDAHVALGEDDAVVVEALARAELDLGGVAHHVAGRGFVGGHRAVGLFHTVVGAVGEERAVGAVHIATLLQHHARDAVGVGGEEGLLVHHQEVALRHVVVGLEAGSAPGVVELVDAHLGAGVVHVAAGVGHVAHHGAGPHGGELHLHAGGALEVELLVGAH